MPISSDSLIGIDVKDVDNVQAKLKALPKEIRDEVNDDVAEYLVELFKRYPRKKHVTRRRAYGKTFFSDKQRRWFFAALADKSIDVPYKRTQTLRNNWQIVGRGEDTIVVNDTPYGELVMGEPGQQTRHEALVGWKSVSTQVKNRSKSILKRAVRAANRAIRKMGTGKIIKF